MAMTPYYRMANSTTNLLYSLIINLKAELAFRDFLRAKYNNDIQLLNNAWGTAFWSEVYSSFDEITLPKRVQMFMNHHQILVTAVLLHHKPMIS